MGKRAALLKENNYTKAKEIAAWKENMSSHWDAIEVEQVQFLRSYIIKCTGWKTRWSYHQHQALNDKGVGIELVVLKMQKQ